MHTIKVLDHGHIGLFEHMGSDLSIVRNARVSYDAEWRTGEDAGKDSKLLKYLIEHNHTSPLESVTFTFDVKCPIFVARQWHRHRTWCVAGDTKVEFVRPCDGKPYQMDIKTLSQRWNCNKVPGRKRHPRTLGEFNRDRIRSMRLRVRGEAGGFEEASVLDVWQSGVKTTYTIRAGGRAIRASQDHLFLTPEGWVPVKELSGRYVCLKGSSGNVPLKVAPDISGKPEEWKNFSNGYDVSTLGRVRSWWGQGARSLRSEAILKKITINNSGRSVVGIGGATVQVSRLVAEAFIPNPTNLPFVLHKDDNPLNNQVRNLYWGTAAQNSSDSMCNGTRQRREFLFTLVDSITVFGEEPVFDMTVDHASHNFIANGFVVHNCYNEISARYAQLPAEYYVPDAQHITTQSKSSKQARTQEPHHAAEAWRTTMAGHCRVAFDLYEAALRDGVPRELARAVLPMSTYTHFFATVNLLNLIKFIKLRVHPHAQWEIQQYARAIIELITPVVPVTMGHLQASLQEISKGGL